MATKWTHTPRMVRRNSPSHRAGLNDSERAKIYRAFLESGRDARATAARFRVTVEECRQVVRRAEEALSASGGQSAALYGKAEHRQGKEIGPEREKTRL